MVTGTELRQNHLYVTAYIVWAKLILTDILPYTRDNWKPIYR
jgi:hypothetical protein